MKDNSFSDVSAIPSQSEEANRIKNHVNLLIFDNTPPARRTKNKQSQPRFLLERPIQLLLLMVHFQSLTLAYLWIKKLGLNFSVFTP